MEEAFLRSMGEPILKAIDDHGEGRLYFLPRITNIHKDVTQGTFDVTVQVVTFERAILPPYGLETITFRIPGNKVIDFKHQKISGEDLPEDKFNKLLYYEVK